MRKVVFTLLAVAVVLSIAGAVFAAPARAMEGMPCDMPMDTIQSLRECVQHAYDMGYITNRGVYRALLSQIDAAQRALDRGQTAAAIGALQAFIQTVSAQAGITIDAQHAEHMIMHAGMVIAALGG